MKKNLNNYVRTESTSPLNLSKATTTGVFNTPAEMMDLGAKVAFGTVVAIGVGAVASPLAELATDAIKKSPLFHKAKAHTQHAISTSYGWVGRLFSGSKPAQA